ncbi:rhodanese-like domain-containing protein [Maioricimonas rarisocia]|uniref:rhodanese-like domain-containing protein n=1 Tax=Maioricimonas rarisocia TaxID=2528026 RepID=UPI0018D25755|nr:rhodanese-like domain-containing protein [Maioricimonas rarisocia]
MAWSQDHYCGVYSAYTVLDHFSQRVPFESLLEPEYVSSYRGSTADEIVRALEDHGVAAKSFNGLSVFDLKTASAPVILHVRGSQGRREYEHWVVYLGERDGEAVVLDPSRGRTSMSFARLLALWDSVGIATSDSSLELGLWETVGTGKRWGMLLLVGCLCFPIVRMLDRWTPRAAVGGLQSTFRAGGLLMALSATAVGMDLLDPVGLLRSSEARGSIASVRAPGELPVISVEEAIELHGAFRETSNLVWIDARFARDYGYGHIPGAYSLPIDATFAEEDELVQRLPRHAKLIVYCQSEGCAFAHAVAERLRGHGFDDIRLFAGGYYEWQKAGAPVEPPRAKKGSEDAANSLASIPLEEEAG